MTLSREILYTKTCINRYHRKQLLLFQSIRLPSSSALIIWQVYCIDNGVILFSNQLQHLELLNANKRRNLPSYSEAIFTTFIVHLSPNQTTWIYMQERRQYPRIPIPNAQLFFDTGEVVGEVLDISNGGLAFRTIDTLKNSSQSGNHGHLCCPECSLQDIPYTVQASIPLPQEFKFSNIPLWRYGIAFGELEEKQQQNLKNILGLYQS